MARPHKCRRIGSAPDVSAFKPVGVPTHSLDSVELQLDELEALRLADLEGCYHQAAAERMGISRPTFGRLVEAARHKVADALLNGKALIFAGGPVMTGTDRTFVCNACGEQFHVPHGTGRPKECPACQSTDFHRVHSDRDIERGGGGHHRRRCRARRRNGAGGGERPRKQEEKPR